jgi:hypothetical protein
VRVQSQRTAQRLVEIRLLPNAQEPTACWPNQNAQPALQELDVVRCRWQLQGLKPVRSPFRSGQYSPPRALTRISSPRSLSKMICTALPLEHRHEKPNEHGLSGAGRTANQGVPGVFARAALGIGRIACVQREVIGRAALVMRSASASPQ